VLRGAPRSEVFAKRRQQADRPRLPAVLERLELPVAEGTLDQQRPLANVPNNVGDVLRRAEAGEEFAITVAGRPVALLGPALRRRWVRGPDLMRVWTPPPAKRSPTISSGSPPSSPGVLQRAVEWGRVPTNAVKITRKPPKPHRPAVQAIPRR
jgi:antitoxin (DNA-binding transcriptional repressor) of toxin-antitoxin stability system